MTDETKTPTRDEIPEADKWDLSHLFKSADKWSEDFAWIQATFPRLTSWKGRVGKSAAALAELLEFEKTLDLKIERVYHFASLQLAEDNANPNYLARMGQLQNLLTIISEAASFIVPEIQAIDDESFARFLEDPALKEWRVRLHKIRRMKPHILSEKEERLLALGSSALAGYDDAFSQLTDVDMKFGVLLDDNGDERPLTQSSFSAFLVKRDHALRKRAFHQFYDEFRDHQFTLAATLAYSVKADVFRARARNYPSALEASLFQDDIPVAVYDRLIAAVRANFLPLYRYYELRRRVLGLDELHAYDTYVPLVGEIETDVSFDEAIEKVLASLSPLGSGVRQFVRRGPARALVRPLRIEGETKRRFFQRKLRRTALYPDELQARRFLRCLHARARGGTLDAYLVCAAPPALSGRRLPDLPRGGGLDL